DANRFSYDFPRPTPASQAVPTSGPAPTTVSTTTTTTTQFPTATTLPRQHTTTEYTTEQDSTESTTNAISPSINSVDANRNNRNRIRFRPKPITTATPPIAAIVETEPATTILPTPPPLPTFAVSSEEFDGAVIKKFRKKPHFTRNRFNVLSQREEEKNAILLDQTEPSLATPTLTTISSTSTTTAAVVSTPAEAAPSISPIGGGFRSRYRPAPKGKDSQEDTQPIAAEGSKQNSRLPSRLPPTASSSTVATLADSAAVFNSDESSINSSEPQNRTRGGEHNRPRFSIKEYRNKLNRTVASTAGPTSTLAPSSVGGEVETTTAPKLRFPTRNRFLVNARLNKTVESNDILPTGTGAVTTEKSANETTTRSSFRPHGTRTYNRFTVKKPSTETPQTSTSSGTTPSPSASRDFVTSEDDPSSSVLPHVCRCGPISRPGSSTPRRAACLAGSARTEGCAVLAQFATRRKTCPTLAPHCSRKAVSASWSGADVAFPSAARATGSCHSRPGPRCPPLGALAGSTFSAPIPTAGTAAVSGWCRTPRCSSRTPAS
ncbi:AGAP008080-PA, partial [Anopheles gambiae str. PEST]